LNSHNGIETPPLFNDEKSRLPVNHIKREKMNPENIPQELRERDKWIITNMENQPLHPTRYHPASAFEPENWITFKKAIELLKSESEVHSIAYVFTQADPYTGIYLSKCISDGKLTKRAGEIYHTFNSYTEISQKADGLNIIIKGRLKSENGHRIKAPGEKEAWLEIYDRRQYFIFTGNIYKEPREIEERLDHLQRFEAELVNKPKTKPDSTEIYLLKNTLRTVVPEISYTEKEGHDIAYQLVGNCPFEDLHTKKSKPTDFSTYITNKKNLYARCCHADCQKEIKTLNQKLNKQWEYSKEGGQSSGLFNRIVNASKYIEQAAPPQNYLVESLLPSGIVGLLTASSGTGKTFWMMSLACAVAGSCEFHGNKTNGGRVLMVCGEETDKEIHRLFSAQMKDFPKTSTRKAIGENLDLLSVHSSNARFLEETEEKTGALGVTALYEELLNSEYKLIILDPLTRFFNANKNDVFSAIRFIELLEAISAKNETTVIISHHTDQDEPAGAIINSIPWVCQLSTLNDASAEVAIDKGYQQIDGDNPEMWVKQSIKKSNSMKPGTTDWYFRRGMSGILERREPFTHST